MTLLLDEVTASTLLPLYLPAPKALHRLFRRETGMSFARWRQQARLLHALERLARCDRIIDVAAETGYASKAR